MICVEKDGKYLWAESVAVGAWDWDDVTSVLLGTSAISSL